MLFISPWLGESLAFVTGVVTIFFKLINYFYSKSFSNSSELTVNIATSYLEEIPIPKINKQNSIIIKEINKKYKNIIQINNEYDSIELDNLVFDLYNINNEERKLVLSE